MIIDCISDLHSHYPKLEGGDLLIVAGDLTADESSSDQLECLSWIQNAKYTKKILIAGNHDNWMKKLKHDHFKEWGFTYLCDSGTTFEYNDKVMPNPGMHVIDVIPSGNNVPAFNYVVKKLKIWGSPWTLRFEGMNPDAMAFTCDTEEELEEKWKLIPDDTDILVTHSPPFGIFDVVRKYGPFSHEREELVGSRSLCIRILDIKPKLHVFGHIHERGGCHMKVNFPSQHCQFANASHVNERYEPVNKPIRLEL